MRYHQVLVLVNVYHVDVFVIAVDCVIALSCVQSECVRNSLCHIPAVLACMGTRGTVHCFCYLSLMQFKVTNR